jgi:hypothetical protein
MIIDLGEKFEFFAAIFVIERIVNDKDFALIALSQRITE